MLTWQTVRIIATWFSIGAAYASIAAFGMGLIYVALPLTGTYKAPSPLFVAEGGNQFSSKIKVSGPITTHHKTQIVEIYPRALSASEQ